MTLRSHHSVPSCKQCKQHLKRIICLASPLEETSSFQATSDISISFGFHNECTSRLFFMFQHTQVFVTVTHIFFLRITQTRARARTHARSVLINRSLPRLSRLLPASCDVCPEILYMKDFLCKNYYFFKLRTFKNILETRYFLSQLTFTYSSLFL
jgi:hypothetical protein